MKKTWNPGKTDICSGRLGFVRLQILRAKRHLFAFIQEETSPCFHSRRDTTRFLSWNPKYVSGQICRTAFCLVPGPSGIHRFFDCVYFWLCPPRVVSLLSFKRHLLAFIEEEKSLCNIQIRHKETDSWHLRRDISLLSLPDGTSRNARGFWRRRRRWCPQWQQAGNWLKRPSCK